MAAYSKAHFVSRAANDYATLTIQLSTLYLHIFARHSRRRKKAVARESPCRVGLWKPKAAKLDSPADAV